MKVIFTTTNPTWNVRAIVEENMGRFYTRSEPVKPDPNYVINEPRTWPTKRKAINAALDIAGEE